MKQPVNNSGVADRIRQRRRMGIRSCGAAGFVVVTLLVGCTYQRAYISYPVTSGELPLQSTPVNGDALGVVRASEGGPVWKECTRVAENAIWVLIEQTKGLGGNAVGNVRWFPDTPRPMPGEAVCKQKWGWILVWPILATPAFQRARVEATAYRVDGPAEDSALFVLPESRSEQAELAQHIVRETLPVLP